MTARWSEDTIVTDNTLRSVIDMWNNGIDVNPEDRIIVLEDEVIDEYISVEMSDSFVTVFRVWTRGQGDLIAYITVVCGVAEKSIFWGVPDYILNIGVVTGEIVYSHGVYDTLEGDFSFRHMKTMDRNEIYGRG